MDFIKSNFDASAYCATIDRVGFGLPEGRGEVVVSVTDVMKFLRTTLAEAPINITELNQGPCVQIPGTDRSFRPELPETVIIKRNQAEDIIANFHSFRENSPGISGDLIPVPDIAA